MKQSIDSGLSDDCFLSSSDASPQAERSSKEGHVWEEGRICLAKWSEDSVWYRARVMCRAAGSVVKVLFIDYGNEEEVDEKDIVKTLGDVPQNDYVDETADELLTSQIKSSKSPDMESKKQDPSNFRSVWMEGDLCVAKWKDGVWYRARIERVLGEDCYRVFFLDYHNEDVVIGTQILKDVAEVPRGEFVDVNVEKESTKDDPNVALSCSVCGKVKKAMSRLLCDGSLICWNCAVIKFQNHKCWKCDLSPAYTRNHLAKDPVLDTIIKEYLATRRLQLGYKVALENSRKQLEVMEEVKTEEGTDVSVTLGCSFCAKTKKAMNRLLCDGSIICWNCAVYRLNKSHVCWKCAASKVNTRNHLVKDPVLDTYMKEYLSTGTLPPGYMEVLENSWKNLEATEEVKEEVGNSCGFSVGDSCLASWSQDGVWYRATVQRVTQGGAEVIFTDYGNTDIVDWGKVCRNFSELAAEADVDQHVFPE